MKTTNFLIVGSTFYNPQTLGCDLPNKICIEPAIWGRPISFEPHFDAGIGNHHFIPKSCRPINGDFTPSVKKYNWMPSVYLCLFVIDVFERHVPVMFATQLTSILVASLATGSKPNIQIDAKKQMALDNHGYILN